MEEFIYNPNIGNIGFGYNGEDTKLNDPSAKLTHKDFIEFMQSYHATNHTVVPTGGSAWYMSPADRQKYNDDYSKNLENRIYQLEDTVKDLTKAVEYLIEKVEPFVKIENARNIINS